MKTENQRRNKTGYITGLKTGSAIGGKIAGKIGKAGLTAALFLGLTFSCRSTAVLADEIPAAPVPAPAVQTMAVPAVSVPAPAAQTMAVPAAPVPAPAAQAMAVPAAPVTPVPALGNAVYDQNVYNMAAKLQAFRMVYQFGDKLEVIDSNITSAWVLRDAEGRYLFDGAGNFALDQNQMLAYLNLLNDRYYPEAVQKIVMGQNKAAAVVTDNGDGKRMDVQAECMALAKDIYGGAPVLREPLLAESPHVSRVDGLGGTYVEIDMSAQMLYYYVNGQLFTSTAVVTGNVARGNATPEQVCALYAKQTQRTLKGKDYEAFVNYWMPIYGNIGLHDATWRSSFGGSIYQNHGSHGCINMPYEQAKLVFENIAVGTPVVMYY